MLNWREHKLLRPPSVEEQLKMSPEELLRAHSIYHEAIENAIRDPYRYGFELPQWGKVRHVLELHDNMLLFGANRASKTQCCAKLVVEAAIENPGALIFCFSQTQETSYLVQQPAIFQYLPVEIRVKANGDPAVPYSARNGFSDNKLVLPNGSRIVFKTYTQWLQNDQILEGMELGCPHPKVTNVGAWLDEYLLGMDLIKRITLRLATFNAKLLISFTPKDGETETVKNYRMGAVTLEEMFVSEGLKNPRNVPTLQYNKDKDTGIVYFHAKDNPWSGYDRLVKEALAANDDNYALTALYGVPTKSVASLFPRFQDHSVVSDEFVEGIMYPLTKHGQRTSGTSNYHIIDPAGSKPWFMVWIAVDATDTWYVYREWPGQEHGPWAEERGGKWVAGEACRQKLGYGVKDYVDLINDLEKEEKVEERWIDPRAGASKYSREGGGQSDYITDLNDHGLYVAPAPRGLTDGKEEDHGIQLLQNRLSFDANKPMDASNRPRLFVAESCKNVIKALQEYDKSSREHPLKDPLDCLRYAAEAEIMFMDGKQFNGTRQGKGGY